MRPAARAIGHTLYSMLNSYDHERVSRERRAFLDGNGSRAVDASIRPEIAASWRESTAAGLLPDALPGESPDLAGRRPAERSFVQDALFREFAEYLSRMDAAFFLVLDDGSVLYSGGNLPVLERLRRFGIRDGADFSVQTVGTTAVALCAASGEEAWVTGAEHYLECLQDYSTFACRADSDFSRYILCLVLPRTAERVPCEALCRYFLRLRAQAAALYRERLEQAKGEVLFNQLKDSLNEALILVDFSRRIMRVNKAVETLFGLAQEDIAGRALTEIFPELESFTSCLLTGQGTHLAEVHFEGLPKPNKSLFVSCAPWQRNGILDGMVITLTRAAKVPKLDETRTHFRDAYTFDDFVGNSRLFQETKEMARSVAKSNSSIILTGESGTGKELFAKAIHNASLRSGKPFVTVNCSAIPRELIGSELFGYTEGAFTGARKGGSMGKFEYAHGGTLFLDEIGELPLEVQAVLLRVLEERTVVRIGANTAVPVDVRIVSATNRNLMQMVRDNRFRLDLYYRLNVITIELPPLRMRPEDIPLLVNHFLESFGAAHGKRVSRVAPEAMERLTSYSWPGNVRQLRNVMERGIAMTASNELRLEHLPAELLGSQDPVASLEQPLPQSGPRTAGVPAPDQQSYSEWERKKIWELMQKHRANKSKIAAELGIARGTLYKKIRIYGL